MSGSPSPRVAAVDRLRGLIVVLMALDHARDFFQPVGTDPERLSDTEPLLFAMRWVTHLCAPGFLFLAGASAAWGRASAEERRGLLWRRGLLLMLLEATWVSQSWQPSLHYTHLGVLWAIGGAMLVLALLWRLPPVALLGLGLALPTAQALLGPPASASLGLALLGWWPAHGAVGGHEIGVSYAILPWFGLLALGRVAAPALARGGWRVAAAGLAALAVFGALRGLGWGDWQGAAPAAASGWKAVAWWLNPSKYPPSAAFQAMTLGVDLLLLAALSRLPPARSSLLLDLGRAPLFFYLLHLPALHLAGWAFARWAHGADRIPAAVPFSAPLVLCAWWGVVLALWLPCRAWARLRAARPELWWLRLI